MVNIKRYIEVLKLAQKPTKSEFYKYSRLVIIGIALLGVIAFIIKIIMTFITLPALG
jgi:protein translocase SEC61 complex gamma subunit